MRKILFFFTILLLVLTIKVSAQYKKDGTPDMRYNSNKSNYGNSYILPNSKSNYNNGQAGTRFQDGYIRDNGTYVQPTLKTNPNSTNLDNFSTEGNSNPFNGLNGTRAKDYSSESLNYGSGQTIQQGPKGGQYYLNSSGNKVYVPKRPNY